MAARARALISAIRTPVGQAMLHARHRCSSRPSGRVHAPVVVGADPEAAVEIRSRGAVLRRLAQPGCLRALVLGPGNRSVTADTGQAVTHIPHLMQRSSVVSTGRWTGLTLPAMGGAVIPVPGGHSGASGEKPVVTATPSSECSRIGSASASRLPATVTFSHDLAGAERPPSPVRLDPGAVDGCPTGSRTSRWNQSERGLGTSPADRPPPRSPSRPRR